MPHKHSTQFVVGATDETDADVLRIVMTSYENYKSARIYYSAFQELEHTSLEKHENTPLWREKRWYQVDSLLLVYSYSRTETSPIFDDDRCS